jgi:hypothetical protein
MTDAELEHKRALENYLTQELRQREPLSRVLISDDGTFAIVQIGDKQSRRNLSRYGKDFIRTGEPVTLGPGESFFETE